MADLITIEGAVQRHEAALVVIFDRFVQVLANVSD